jgi:hypothetical protein
MKRKQILAELRKFAVELHDTPSVPESTETRFIPSVAFANADYGVISFSGESGSRYTRIIQELGKTVVDTMSQNSVTKLVQIALFKTIDIRKQNQSVSVEDRAIRAANEVECALAADPIRWTNCIPVLGLKPPTTPWKLGEVTLINIAGPEGKEVLAHAEQITNSTKATAATKTQVNLSRQQQLIDDHPGQAFALVATDALDSDIAWATAKRRLRYKLDCLNFAMEFIYGNLEYYALTDDEPRKRHYSSGLTLNVTDFSLCSTQNDLVNGPV